MLPVLSLQLGRVTICVHEKPTEVSREAGEGDSKMSGLHQRNLCTFSSESTHVRYLCALICVSHREGGAIKVVDLDPLGSAISSGCIHVGDALLRVGKKNIRASMQIRCAPDSGSLLFLETRFFA